MVSKKTLVAEVMGGLGAAVQDNPQGGDGLPQMGEELDNLVGPGAGQAAAGGKNGVTITGQAVVTEAG